jgi:hypothetical protein
MNVFKNTVILQQGGYVITQHTFVLNMTQQKLHSSCHRAGPLNPQLAGNTLFATQCYFARGTNRNEEPSFSSFPGKAEIHRRSNFEKTVSY